MLTQSAPAIVKALTGVLPPGALQQLTQALGNCEQPLTHRGQVNIPGVNPATAQQGLAAGQGGSGRWNPADYPGLIPSAGFGGFADMGGHQPDWNSNNYGGSQFFFPTNSYFNQNQFFGGPTMNVGGNSYFNNAYSTTFTTENINTNNITTININGEPAGPGPSGPPGSAGAAGQNGMDGELPVLSTATLSYVADITVTPAASDNITAITKISFDPETCEINVDETKQVPTKWRVTVNPRRESAVVYAP